MDEDADLHRMTNFAAEKKNNAFWTDDAQNRWEQNVQHFVVIFGRLRVIFRKVIQLGALVNNIVCSQGASSISGVPC